MRVIAGILPPTQGRIEVYGSVSTLLALGVGFNPSMSGRDNVYLGGLAAGMSRDEIDSHFEEIAEFSELGEAIDAPMRTYSSGMYARLAFSVAATVRPDILIVDESHRLRRRVNLGAYFGSFDTAAQKMGFIKGESNE
jgi:ABC-type polysaccharide/polyol phosphate transport system ATPase subunit